MTSHLCSIGLIKCYLTVCRATGSSLIEIVDVKSCYFYFFITGTTTTVEGTANNVLIIDAAISGHYCLTFDSCYCAFETF